MWERHYTIVRKIPKPLGPQIYRAEDMNVNHMSRHRKSPLPILKLRY